MDLKQSVIKRLPCTWNGRDNNFSEKKRFSKNKWCFWRKITIYAIFENFILCHKHTAFGIFKDFGDKMHHKRKWMPKVNQVLLQPILGISVFWLILLEWGWKWHEHNEPSHEIMALFILHKLILQMCMHSHPMGLDVWFFIRPFVYFHSLCVHIAKALGDCTDAQASWAFGGRLCGKYHNLTSWLISSL